MVSFLPCPRPCLSCPSHSDQPLNFLKKHSLLSTTRTYYLPSLISVLLILFLKYYSCLPGLFSKQSPGVWDSASPWEGVGMPGRAHRCGLVWEGGLRPMGFVSGKRLCFCGGSTFCTRSYLCWKTIRHGIPALFGLSFRDGWRANDLGR